MKFIIDENSIIINCEWVLMHLDIEMIFKQMIVLVVEKGCDCDEL